jgi:hypothetical protein
VAQPATTEGPYRSATVRTSIDHGPPPEYLDAADKLERKVREERVLGRTPVVLWVAFYVVMVIAAFWSHCTR